MRQPVRREYRITGTERIGNRTEKVIARVHAYSREQASYLAQKENIHPIAIRSLGAFKRDVSSCL